MILILRISPGEYTLFLPNLATDGEKTTPDLPVFDTKQRQRRYFWSPINIIRHGC
jgi:hypothetical protein